MDDKKVLIGKVEDDPTEPGLSVDDSVYPKKGQLGVVDKSFPIPWENFKNMVLVTNSDGLNRISTRIYKIITVEK